MASLSIGTLSRQTGVKIPTIRYYEDMGLLPEADRTSAGRRTYGQVDIERLSFVRHARDLGFPMGDVKALIDLTKRPQQSCHAADSIARQNLETIEKKIDALTALRDELKRMVDTCANGSVAECRVMQVLSDHHQCLHNEHERP